MSGGPDYTVRSRRTPHPAGGACILSNMASSGILLLCLIFLSVPVVKSGNNFLTVTCQKDKIVAQYGSSTLLDCVVRAHDKITEPIKIITLIWKFKGKPLLTFFMGKFKVKKAGFELASRSWNDSNQNVSLLITNTSLDDDGEYECNVVAETGRNGAKVYLEVKSNYREPEIHSDPKEINPEKSFSLTCTALGGYPKGDIRWMVDNHAWLNNPEVIVKKTQNGLYDLASTLSFGSDTQYTKFVCEVYNAERVKEGQQEFEKPNTGKSTDNEKGITHTQIVAPVVVIGTMIVGLLMAILFCRRRQQNITHAATPDENDKMYEDL